MTDPAVHFDVEGAVATLTFADEARMNPLTPAFFAGAFEAIERVHADASIRVLVLAARGKGFCVGADLADLQRRTETGDGGGVSVAIGELMDESGNPLVLALRALPVPVLAVVQGAVAGGGVGIARAAAGVGAARSAYFMLPFVPALGLVPDMGSSWFLQRAVGSPRALGMALLGDRLSAEQAAAWGVIWRCVDDEALAAEASRLAARLAALPAHAALETRALFRAAAENTLPGQLAYERDRQTALAGGPCLGEGVSAFLARRRPVFAGREPS